MKNQSKNSSVTLKKIVFWAACFALIISLILFVLEKTRVTNIYTKPATSAPTSGSDTRPVNSVDYSPATTAEQPTTEQKTQDTNTTNTSTSPTQPVIITLSAATQDTPGGPVVIRTILENANGGKCTVTLTKDSTVKTYTSDITWTGTYYSCNKDIPFADLSVGTWQLKIVANQDSKQGAATANIAVKAN